jgi:hypothetical protein
MEVQKSANCDLCGYFIQFTFSCRAGNILSALLHVAFSATKQTLAKAALLAHPTPGAEVALMVGASGYHVGGGPPAGHLSGGGLAGPRFLLQEAGFRPAAVLSF